MSTASVPTPHITTLLVCTKCARRDLPESCAAAGVCRLSNTNPLLADMEDLISGPGGRADPSLMSAGDVASGASVAAPDMKIKTGRKLYHRLRARQLDVSTSNVPLQNLRRRRGDSYDASAVSSVQKTKQLRILPVACLSNCDRGNCIAVMAPGKYTYQFGDLDERRTEVLDDVMRFVNSYMESEDGFSKTKTRPAWMKSNVLARIPPLPMPGNIIPDWYDPVAEGRLEKEELERRVRQKAEEEEKQRQRQQQLLKVVESDADNHREGSANTVDVDADGRERCDCRQDFV
ncbi:hypothetical protein THASP1DRAFT_23374 [Thamnocephalis sphaerospora]|uniref:Uncharacterized protein n=1 Tax=Thamnocephalis sphaerospora TaxID=78915 RepID=A0A4P9XRJ7_9FUNG|nr:hypothetical protein THASP1DRAFT_23374 [Thamnocephalis sphaerospora]|eukprot:RKP08688.1 hypothetical protein THASP1DRAFT_23374 [Thamnocephalis sphaerospora]